jgi:hypothetical protein
VIGSAASGKARSRDAKAKLKRAAVIFPSMRIAKCVKLDKKLARISRGVEPAGANLDLGRASLVKMPYRPLVKLMGVRSAAFVR